MLLTLRTACFAGEQLHFIHYNKERSGLCHDGIRTLLQDGSGYLWVGTYNGLARFDGRNFISYDRSDFGTSTDYICSLCEEEGGRLWVGTDEGIVVYEPKTRKFSALRADAPSARVYSLVRDARGTIWAGAREDGLWRIDPGSRHCTRLALKTPSGEDINNVFRISTDLSGNVYFCSYCDNLYCLDAADSCRVLCGDYFHLDDIQGIACGPAGSGIVYVASKRSGLCAVNPDTGEVDVLLTLPSHQRPVNLRYKGRYLYLCTTGGFIRYDLMTQSRDYISSAPDDPFSLSDNFVTDICLDNNGGLWAATSYNGLNYSSPLMNNFERYYRTSDGEGLAGCSVRGFAQSPDGRVWIATENKGLLCFNPSDGELKAVKNNSLPASIVAICAEGDDLWLGYSGGLCRYGIRNGVVRKYTHIFGASNPDDTEFHDNRVVSIYVGKDPQPRLYIATTVGVSAYDASTDSFTALPCLDGVTVEDMQTDASGMLWIASYSQGLYLYDPATSSLKGHFAGKTPKGFIPEMNSAVCVDNEGSAWGISFNGGVFHYNPATDSFDRFGRSNVEGIETEVMLEGIFDSKNRLWIASDDGLILFDTAGRSATTFTVADGLLDNQFNKAALMLADGRIIMGNKGGFILFDPALIDATKKALFVASEPYDNVMARRIMIISLLVVLLAAAIILLMSAVVHRRAMRRQEELHKEAQQQMQERLYQEKMSFFASIIHEIKTPLTLIRTPLEKLREASDMDSEKMEDVRLISSSTDYLEALVRELLEFITVEQHGYVLDVRNIDIVDRIGFICSNYLETAKARSLDFRFVHEQESLMCAVDTKILSKIVNNLLHNALKYADSYVRVELKAQEDSLKIIFTNDGKIIPDDKREMIFKPFVHFDNGAECARSFGIGLPLARKLSQLHGGSLELSERRDCNEFVVSLPLRLVEEPSGEVDEAAEETLGRQSGLPMVLLVEDNSDMLSYLKRKLAPEYMVVGVRTGEEALAKVDKYKFDLIVTDIGLPGMSGVDLCRALKENAGMAHVPVIVLSAVSTLQTKIQCMENGASMYVEKPFSLDYLLSCIRSLLEKRRNMKTVYASADAPVNKLQLDLPDRDDDFVRRLDKLIADNIGVPGFTNKQIEEALFVSRSSLNRKMKNLLGTTANDYIRNKRLEAASQMLSRGGVRVNEVCYAVGFSSPSYFARCFKEKYGILPAEYAKENRHG